MFGFIGGAMSADLVTLEVREGIADVRLNRAKKYNALSPEMFSAIQSKKNY